MESRAVDGLTLYYDATEEVAANLVAAACERSLRLNLVTWGFSAPRDCRVYIITSAWHFLFHAASWPWRIAAAITSPFWVPRAKRLWPLAGGFHQALGQRRVIGVKPPRLIAEADLSLGKRLYVPKATADLAQKVQQVTCHELTHACAAHLKPPMWLNEGLAMRTVDLYAGEPTVRADTLDLLAQGPESRPAHYQDVDTGDKDALLYHVARGYWLTRLLEENYPDLLTELVSAPHGSTEIDAMMSGPLGVDPTVFWQDIDGTIVTHFALSPREED